MTFKALIPAGPLYIGASIWMSLAVYPLALAFSTTVRMSGSI